jgi:hypothetical protein
VAAGGGYAAKLGVVNGGDDTGHRRSSGERDGPAVGGNEVVDGRWAKLKGWAKAERRLETKGKPTSGQSSWHKEDKVCAVGGPSLTICCSPWYLAHT